MPLSAPRDSTIAIVGDGFGSLIVYSTAVYLGFAPEQITVYGPSDNPVGTYQQFAYNLGQTVLRSESESHFLPADWPTFAQLEAWSRKSLSPLLRSITRKYNPGVPDVLAEAAVVHRALRWNDNRYPARVGWLQREWGPPAHMVLFDEQARMIGRARHVMIAPGHGPLQFPPTLARARDDPALAERIVQAYEPKQYAAGGRYLVIGAGIASVNEWANAIDAGASVLTLLRQPLPDEQDLNTPRCLFEALGVDVFQGLSFDDRVAFLGKILKGTSPARRGWAARIQAARAAGRFDELLGEVERVEAGPAGLRVHLSSRFGPIPQFVDVTGIVAGTGFTKAATAIPLIRRLVEHYEVPVEGGRLKLRRNCGLPGVDTETSRVCLMGLLANNVVPHGDTIAGLKYIGRRFVGDCLAAERIRKRGFASRARMQLALSAQSARAVRRARRVAQLA